MRRHPHLYELSAWPWLERLSRRADRHVTLADGTPARSATVQAISDVPRQYFSVRTDASGAYEISGVATGDFRITFRDANNKSAGSYLGRLDTHGPVAAFTSGQGDRIASPTSA